MSDAKLDRLLEAAFRQTLASFREQLDLGERDPQAELAGYRRRRRDYATALRIDVIPEEARTLAARLLDAHGLAIEGEKRAMFERNVLEMLVRLYDTFIAEATQGNR